MDKIFEEERKEKELIEKRMIAEGKAKVFIETSRMIGHPISPGTYHYIKNIVIELEHAIEHLDSALAQLYNCPNDDSTSSQLLRDSWLDHLTELENDILSDVYELGLLIR